MNIKFFLDKVSIDATIDENRISFKKLYFNLR